MATVLESLEQAEASANDALQHANALRDAGRPAEAKKAITAGEAALRHAKSELVAQEREVRAKFKQARLNLNKQGQTVGMFMGSKARGNISRARAAGKRNLAQEEHDALAPYASAKAAIDSAVAGLGSAKLEMDSAPKAAASPVAAQSAGQEASPPPSPTPTAPPPVSAPPPPPTPPQWAPDPFGRHEHRWWDGTAWTEHVANRGERTTDPPNPGVGESPWSPPDSNT
jgi:Protein of unknown function (DUF2510)